MMSQRTRPRIATFIRWCSLLMVVPAFAMCGQLLGRQQSPDVADTQPEDEDVTASVKIPTITGGTTWKAGSTLGVVNNGHGIGVLSGTGTYSFYAGRQELTGAVTADGHGEVICATRAPWTTTSEFIQAVPDVRGWTAGAQTDPDFRNWHPGAPIGVIHNGHGLGVLRGTGTFVFYAPDEVTGVLTADGQGGVTYSNVTRATTTGEYWDGGRRWKAGAVFGITHNGHGLGVLSGAGALHFSESGADVAGDVTADGHGGFIYSNVANRTTTSEYWDGVRIWKAGAIVGITGGGKGIGVMSGTGRLDYFGSGAHATGDVVADGKGGLVYSNVANGTTTSEYWDGIRIWKTGAVVGITGGGKGIGVISGTGRLDYFGSGAHVTGDVVADGKGGLAYSNVVNGATTSDYWDGAKAWKAGAVLGPRGKGIGVISGTGRLDYFGSGAHVTGDVVADGEGRFVYSNVTNGTTTSDYWDGAKMWKAGAVLGRKGKDIGVISGTAKLD